MEMRRKEKMISREEILEVLASAEYGILSTVGADGMPYGTPVNFAYADDAIYFHCAKEGHKLSNLKSNNSVCFTAVDSVELMPEKFNTKYRSVIAFGTASTVEDDEEKKKALLALLQNLSPDFL